MSEATSISLGKFTASVQAAVKAAVAKHPKFNSHPPRAVTVSYLIRGIPVPEAILKEVTVGETQAFANEVAAGIASAHPEAFSARVSHPATKGAFLFVDGHLILGIPPVLDPIELHL